MFSSNTMSRKPFVVVWKYENGYTVNSAYKVESVGTEEIAST